MQARRNGRMTRISGCLAMSCGCAAGIAVEHRKFCKYCGVRPDKQRKSNNQKEAHARGLDIEAASQFLGEETCRNEHTASGLSTAMPTLLKDIVWL